jgi:hypothetical protein
MMVSVLLRLKPSGLLTEYPNLAAYVARKPRFLFRIPSSKRLTDSPKRGLVA